MFLNMALEGNEYIQSPQDLIMMLALTKSFKDMAETAMFGVSEVFLDMGLDYIRSKDTGANATYALSVKV